MYNKAASRLVATCYMLVCFYFIACFVGTLFLPVDAFAYIVDIVCNPTCDYLCNINRMHCVLANKWLSHAFSDEFDRSHIRIVNHLRTVPKGTLLSNPVHLHDHLTPWRIRALLDRIMNLDIQLPRISLALFAIERAPHDRT